jgi:hypothetical protein
MQRHITPGRVKGHITVVFGGHVPEAAALASAS